MRIRPQVFTSQQIDPAWDVGGGSAYIPYQCTESQS